MRFIGMDVHRDFCEIAIVEPDGQAHAAGRINTVVEELELFARSLAADDVVALEATSGAGLIAEIIEPHVAAVLVANTRKLPQISRAKAKTDRLDARTLARLAGSGFLETVWAPDERTRALRRLCARREALVRARTRAKNEAHAVPARNLCGRPPVTDCFGKKGRAWLAGQGAMVPQIEAVVRPVFPLVGRHAVALGLTPGPAIGAALRHVRDWWLAGGCRADQAACLGELRRLVSEAAP